MLVRQISLARGIARVIRESTVYELLLRAAPRVSNEQELSSIYIIVLFRAKDSGLNRELTKRLNATRKLYVSGTQWEGQPATRFAVANWQVNVERGLALVKEVLDEAAR